MRRRDFVVGLTGLTACRAIAIEGPPRPRAQGVLRVMTLNLAHGRARALAQSRARPARWFRANLDAIAEVIDREQPEVLALQEAELGSRWAGDFDHVAYLAERTGLSSIAATPHVRAEGRYRYGTAVLSRVAMLEHGGSDFVAQARWHKGWTWATIDALGGPLTVVSVHLDFASAARRTMQARELATAFADRDEPIVVLGDFNAQWRDEGSPVAALATALDLHTLDPLARGPVTYPFSRRRLDWILADDALHLTAQRVLDDRLSDHRAVVAEVSVDGPRRTAEAKPDLASPAPPPRAG